MSDVKVHRTKLYDEVWSTPMTRLAERTAFLMWAFAQSLPQAQRPHALCRSLGKGAAW